MRCSRNGNVIALVVRGIYSAFGAVCPVASMSVEHATLALKSYIGDALVRRFYFGHADERVAAATTLGTPHEASQQSVPQTNGVIER